MATQAEERRAQAFEFIKSLLQEPLAECLNRRLVYGYADHTEGPYHLVNLFAGLGDRFTGSVRRISDAQSGWLDESPSTDMSGTELTDGPGKVSVTDLWVQVQDESASVQDRLEAIHKLLGADRENAIQYLAGELAREGTHQDWLIALVFLAEDVRFPADRQQVVKDALLRIAHSFRKSTKAGADRVVWSAIRRASSLLAPTQVNLLVPFLERDGVVDARAVTLKCVVKLFLLAPPENPELVRVIGDRAHTLAMKFLDPDIFGGGEHALLAQSAVCTLAAIGDSRLGDVVTLAARLNRRWLKHQLRTRLYILRTSWQSKDAAITASGAFRDLEAALSKLC